MARYVPIRRVRVFYGPHKLTLKMITDGPEFTKAYDHSAAPGIIEMLKNEQVFYNKDDNDFLFEKNYQDNGVGEIIV